MQTSILDAGGRVPAPVTAFEQKIAALTQNGGMAQAQAELNRKQALPLQDKIALSAPMSFWTEQDVLQCIRQYNIPVPSVYGDIRQDDAGRYHTTGVHRTGCVFCCFGLHLDEGDKNRFELLAESHPRLHRLVMDRLGLGCVLGYCRENAPARLAKTFRCGYREE